MNIQCYASISIDAPNQAGVVMEDPRPDGLDAFKPSVSYSDWMKTSSLRPKCRVTTRNRLS